MTNLKPLAVQLYSLREEAKKDFVGVLKRVAEIGYKGVEPAGFWNLSPVEFKKIIDDLGLEMRSSHSPWVRPENVDESMETAHLLGMNKLVCGSGPDDFKDIDSIRRFADTYRAINEKLSANGFTLFQHNHYWEFDRLDGRIKYEIYRELNPGMKYEIDCFWSTNMGREDAVKMLNIFADDTILLHIKDGVTKQVCSVDGMKNGLLDCKTELLPLGTGTLPIRQIVAAMPPQIETIIVELDYCHTMDMFDAIEQSYRFMTENGLAAGNK